MQFINSYQGYMNPNQAASIASSASASSIVDCGGLALCGIFIPAAFTGTTITFQASADGINFFPMTLNTAGNNLSYAVAPSTYVAINPLDFQGVQYLKVVSGSTEAGARSLILSLKGF